MSSLPWFNPRRWVTGNSANNNNKKLDPAGKSNEDIEDEFVWGHAETFGNNYIPSDLADSEEKWGSTESQESFLEQDVYGTLEDFEAEASEIFDQYECTTPRDVETGKHVDLNVKSNDPGNVKSQAQYSGKTNNCLTKDTNPSTSGRVELPSFLFPHNAFTAKSVTQEETMTSYHKGPGTYPLPDNTSGCSPASETADIPIESATRKSINPSTTRTRKRRLHDNAQLRRSSRLAGISQKKH